MTLATVITLGVNAQSKPQAKYGFINTKGKVVIPLKYEKACDFNEGYAVVLNGNKELLIIDKKGKETLIKNKGYDASFSFSSPFIFSEGLCAVTINKRYGFINTKGEEVIPCQYETPIVPKDADSRMVKDIPKFINGVAVIYINGFYGVINKSGKIVVPIEYQFITHFKNNLAVFKKDIAAVGSKGIMDVDGKIIVIPTKSNKDIWIEDDNIVRLHYVDGQFSNFYSIYNNKGEEINKDNHFNYLSEFENGLALYGTKKEPNVWGVIDAMGNKKPLTEKYAFNPKEPRQFKNGYLYAIKMSDKKMVVLNNKGERISNCEYDYLYELNKEGIAYGIKGGTNASFFNDKNCAIIYETKMDGKGNMNYIFSYVNKIYPFKGGYASINKDYGNYEKKEIEYILIDKTGKITYSVMGNSDCSLEPDDTETGIYIYYQRDRNYYPQDRNSLDYKKPDSNLYLQGNGKVLYKGLNGSKGFKDGLALVFNL